MWDEIDQNWNRRCQEVIEINDGILTLSIHNALSPLLHFQNFASFAAQLSFDVIKGSF